MEEFGSGVKLKRLIDDIMSEPNLVIRHQTISRFKRCFEKSVVPGIKEFGDSLCSLQDIVKENTKNSHYPIISTGLYLIDHDRSFMNYINAIYNYSYTNEPYY